jgi:hypothetical protein
MTGFRRIMRLAQVGYQLLAILLAIGLAAMVVAILARQVESTVAANTRIVHGTQEIELQTQQLTKLNTARALDVAQHAVDLLAQIRADQEAQDRRMALLLRLLGASPAAIDAAGTGAPLPAATDPPAPSATSARSAPSRPSQGRAVAASPATAPGVSCYGQVASAGLICSAGHGR